MFYNVPLFSLKSAFSSRFTASVVDFLTLKPYDLKKYVNHVCFRQNQTLRVKQKNKEESVWCPDWCQCGKCKPIGIYMQSHSIMRLMANTKWVQGR